MSIFFEPDVVNTIATCTRVIEITISVTQVEGGYRVRRKQRELFTRNIGVLGKVISPFETKFVIRVIIVNLLFNVE